MNSLFSVFDPNSYFLLPLNWFSVLAVFFVIPTLFWVGPNSFSSFILHVAKQVNKEFKTIFSGLPMSGLTSLSMTFFLFIIVSNILGLFPYIFTSTAHLVMTLSLALPAWVGLTSISWVKTTQNSLAHLVPMGAPNALSPFMVLIELVSTLIRPITLSVRLAANMVAGHLLMTLISTPMCSLPVTLGVLTLSALLLLSVLESAVALIQAYVFSVLSCLYMSEVNSVNFN